MQSRIVSESKGTQQSAIFSRYTFLQLNQSPKAHREVSQPRPAALGQE